MIEESDGSLEAILDILGNDPAGRFVQEKLEEDDFSPFSLENMSKRQRTK
jgi:hypothetical protein